MHHQFAGTNPRPQLFIDTQFSSEEESDTLGHFQFEPKDVISETSSYGILQEQYRQGVLMNDRGSEEHYDALITGLVQLKCIVESWQVNAVYDAFATLKEIKPKRFASLGYGRTTSKELHHSKSITNLRNQNNLVNRLHERKNRSSNHRNLERAEVLKEIMGKLHSREKSDGSRSKSQTNKSSSRLRKSNQKKEVVKQKLKKLEHMLKDYKQVNEKSNQKSTVYYTKHYNRSHKAPKYAAESSAIEDQAIMPNGDQMGAFKKLKNDIMQVKTQFNELKHINELYRRENSILKTKKMSEDVRDARGAPYKNISTDGEIRHSPANHWQESRLFQPHHSSLHPNYVPGYPQNHPMGYPQLHPPPSYIPNYPQPYPIPSYPSYMPHYPNDFRQTNYRIESHKCRDARHENYWKTMVPENLQFSIKESGVEHIREQPIVFCFKCGCKCAQKNDRSSITQRKEYVTSPLTHLKDLL